MLMRDSQTIRVVSGLKKGQEDVRESIDKEEKNISGEETINSMQHYR